MSLVPPRSYDVELDDEGECARLKWTCPEEECSTENSEPYRLLRLYYPLKCAPRPPGEPCEYVYEIGPELLEDIRQKCERARAARAAG